MGGGGPPGELGHHRAVDDDSLYIVGVWESEEAMRTRFASPQMREVLVTAGFPPMDQAEMTVLRLHAVEPAL
jgi:quinol monooxygenase YgiN